MTRAWSVVALLLASLSSWSLVAAPALAADTVTIRPNSKPGQTWNVSSDTTTDMKITLTPEGGQVQQGGQKMVERMKGTVTVLKVADGKPTSVRVKFDDSCGGQVQVNGQQQQQIKSPLAGKTVTIQRNEDGEVTHDAKVGDAESMILSGMLDQDDAYYPGKPVAIGETWKPAPELVAKNFHLSPDDEVTLSCTLDSMDESGPQKVAVVTVAVNMVRKQGPLTIKINGKGPIRIDLATGKLLSSNLKGTINSDGEQSAPGPNGDVNTKIVGKGTTLIVSSAKLLAGGADDGGGAGEDPVVTDDSQPKPAAGGVAGDYAGEGIAVTLKGAGKAITGTIKIGEDTFPLTANANGNAIKGAFKSDADSYDFTARLDGGTLSLSSGGSDYTLKRKGANPLSKPKKPNPLVKPQAPAPDAEEKTDGAEKDDVKEPGANADPKGGQVLRFRRFALKDDQVIPGEAASFLIPADWKVTGGIKWRAHIYYPSYLDMQITAADGVEQLNFLPAIPGFWPTQPMFGFPEGSLYAGNLVRPPMAPETFIKKLGIPFLRKKLTSATEVKTEELPEMAKAILDDTPKEAGIQKSTKASKVRYRYEENGVAIDEDVYCVMLYSAGQAGTFWNTERLFSFRARAGELEQHQAILATLQTSVRPNLAWFNRYYQIIEMRHQAGMQAIHDVGEWSKMYAKTSGEISDTITKSYWDRQASQDRVNHSFSQSIRGVESYKDPQGYGYELPSGYNNAWVNNRGEVIVSTEAGYNPGIELKEDWHPLEKTAQ